MTSLQEFLDRNKQVAALRLTRTRGSSPREQGAAMYVSPNATHGTIGGGQLEFMAIDAARRLLWSGNSEARLDLPLGPEIGQCCGGRVVVSITLLDAAGKISAIETERAKHAAYPEVMVFGAGHVGRALAAALLPLPVNCQLIDTRQEELVLSVPGVRTLLSPLPEATVRAAQPNSAFVVMTHDHSLDFLITEEALARGDALYVGMIGSQTKRVQFDRFAARHGVSTQSLTCPMAIGGTRDKRPEVLAALIAAELMNTLLSADLPVVRSAKSFS